MKEFTDSKETPGVSIDEPFSQLMVSLCYATFGVNLEMPMDKPADQPWLWFGGASVFCRYDPCASRLQIEERRSPASDRGRHQVWLNLPPDYTNELQHVEIVAGGAVACTGLQVHGELHVQAWRELLLANTTAGAYFGKAAAGPVKLAGLRLTPGESPGAAFYAPANEIQMLGPDGWQRVGRTASLNVLHLCAPTMQAAMLAA